MDRLEPAQRAPTDAGPGGSLYGALDLGTNNCRLLIAAPARAGFRVIDSFSQIVRLGEGLAATGRLGEAAMARAIGALKVCAAKLFNRRVRRVRAVATEACRRAANGAAFIERARQETGLDIEVIPASEESRLAVAGCQDLADTAAQLALVVDVGGGSTELSWFVPRPTPGRPLIEAWASAPVGVVTLAETAPPLVSSAAFEAAVGAVEAMFRALPEGRGPLTVHAAGAGQVIGASGAVTCLAGVHLQLARYQRARVDGLWMSAEAVRATAHRLVAMSLEERAAHPCIGPQRADLVAPGAAIVEAVLRVWPAARLRVADRGLREGILLGLMAEDRTA
jgi:exopolyphosphatase/guanosine-5'-triphosphate,3'-diphosphate pyrophosphatase